jgi:hypothetical protein
MVYSLGALLALVAVQVSTVWAESPKLAGDVYTDPKGFFKIRPPADWTVEEYKSDPRGKVNFNWMEAGKKAQLKVLGAANPFADFDELVQDCKNGIERLRARMGGTYTVETTTLFGQKAALILMSLPSGFRQYQLQFIAAGNYYTLAYGTDQQLYEKYLPLAKASIETLEALPKQTKPEEGRAHTLQSKIRLAQLHLQIGRKDWALTAINEGLAIDPNNEELLKLKKEAEAK